MAISAQDVKNLREKTGAGMMDCKKALAEVDGNFDAAVDYLKKQGLAKAVKKGDRIAAEGLVFFKEQNNLVALVEINCETDFVAKNDDFQKLGSTVLDLVLNKKPASLDELLQIQSGDNTVEALVNSLIAVIGEKISIRRFALIDAKAGGKLITYNHAGGRIVVSLEVTGNVSEDDARGIAMHIAAMNPQYLSKEEVSESVIAKEKEIQLEQLKESGKPVEMLEKILAGKMDKFASELSLLQQVYVKAADGKQRIEQFLKACDASAKIAQFVRFEVGEGIEKRKDDFAEEVAKMSQ